MKRRGIAVCLLLLAPAAVAQAAPDPAALLATMKQATRYMMDTVSYRGGFVGKYTEDLSGQWGEVPARRSMVWVQDPGTVDVGRTMLACYRATGDPLFLEAAKKCASALLWGQLPCGGWNYFIDFEPERTAAWYESVGSRAWGWEEFYHFHGNATFDDNTTTFAADFLLDLYLETDDPAYRAPVMRAVHGILESQYPVGGWPQRFPVLHQPDGAGHTDYTAYHTFNDNVIVGNIRFMRKCYRALGIKACEESALRGMYFVMTAQWGAPQAGWAQQYDMNLEPGGARSYEPKSLSPSTTADCIHDLLRFYKVTGDRRFLRGIPDALDWLDRARLPEGHSSSGHTHAQFVELGTNRPLYAHREGTSRATGRYWVDYEPGNFPGHYGMQVHLDVPALQQEYQRVYALDPEAALAEGAWHETKPEVPAATVVQSLLDAQNSNGMWIEDLVAVDHTDWKYKPRKEFRGISTRTFCNNMKALARYVAAST
jgi:PelA/Pel-15E family pectate lyase